jgi:hypothetical protein
VPSLERLRVLAADVAPVTLAAERTLPVLDGLGGLVPGGALVRGSTVAVVGHGHGATALALALAAGPSAAGSWVAAVGVPSLGLAAAAEVGVALHRLAVIAEPPPDTWATVMASLVGSVDVVLSADPHRAGANATALRRLAARQRERGTVHLVLGARPAAAAAADVVLTVRSAVWQGLGDGHGTLRARQVEVEVSGRRGAHRPRTVPLWLPAVGGGVEPVPRLVAVEPVTTGVPPAGHLADSA